MAICLLGDSVFSAALVVLLAVPVLSLERYHPLMRDWRGAGTFCTVMMIYCAAMADCLCI